MDDFGPDGIAGTSDDDGDFDYQVRVVTTPTQIGLQTSLDMTTAVNTYSDAVNNGYDHVNDGSKNIAGWNIALDNTVDYSDGSFGDNDDQFLVGDFGFVQAATIGNYVWYDSNRDGIQDNTESGIAGVTVYLYTDTDHDGDIDAVDTASPLLTDITDGSGYYLFTDLVPGLYQVQFVPPSGFVISPRDAGLSDVFDSDAVSIVSDPLYGWTIVTDLTSNEVDLSWDMGLYEDENIGASLGDTVWFDSDGDGIQDANEDGVAGVTVTLWSVGGDGMVGGGDDSQITSQLTDMNGYYLFDGLDAGTYYVMVLLPDGYSFTTQDATGDGAYVAGVGGE
ncbi:MAG: hypothetical protein H6546_07065 [Chitinophagales bacterium]|nr:hypothetical protein [Chitinophagales bacterium]